MSSFLPPLNTMFQHFTWLNTCKAGTLVLATHMVHIGLWSFTSPRSLCAQHGLRFDGKAYHSSSREEKTEEIETPRYWSLLFGCREVGLGALLFAFAGLGEWKAAALTVGLVGAFIAGTDGLVAAQYGKGGFNDAIWSHGVPGVVLCAFSYGLLQN